MVVMSATALMGACCASAQGAPTISEPLPDLNVPEQQWGDDRKYVILHKAGVSVTEAEADFGFCWRFLPHGVQRRSPSFVPWRRGEATRPVSYDGGAYGLVGAAIGAIIQGPLERSIRQSRLYACMLPRGYARYRTSEDVWGRLNDDENPQKSIRLQALIAAGPVPPTARMEP
ncbi:MAG TPA: hypothetical protein VJM09_08420 [Sphingobium sp.]|nr:hypothetical protein [Sphingobium sp.]